MATSDLQEKSVGTRMRLNWLYIISLNLTTRHHYGNAVPLFDHGSVRGAGGSITEITDRNPAEADLGKDGLSVYFRDITDRKRAAKERQEIAESYESRVFETTLSTITDFAYIFDTEGRFRYAALRYLLWVICLRSNCAKRKMASHGGHGGHGGGNR